MVSSHFHWPGYRGQFTLSLARLWWSVHTFTGQAVVVSSHFHWPGCRGQFSLSLARRKIQILTSQYFAIWLDQLGNMQTVQQIREAAGFEPYP
jgi:hypothetical protein